MSRGAEIDLDWAGDERRFRLPIGQIRELQDKVGLGPMAILRKLLTDDWLVDEVREVLRIGLIGGGMEPPKALRLVRLYVDDNRKAWLYHARAARAVMQAALSLASDEPIPTEDDSQRPNGGAPKATGSPSESSTQTEQSSADGPLERSTSSPSGN